MYAQPMMMNQGGIASMANQLADMGTYEDDQIAHVATGEVIVPRQIMESQPEVRKAVFEAIAETGVDPRQFIVGNELVMRNPATGIQEFGFLKKLGKKLKKVVKKLAPIVVPIVVGSFTGGLGLGAIGGGFLSGAATTAIMGGNREEILKGGITGGVLGGASKAVSNLRTGSTGGYFGEGTPAPTTTKAPGVKAPEAPSVESAAAQSVKPDAAQLAAEDAVMGQPIQATEVATTGTLDQSSIEDLSRLGGTPTAPTVVPDAVPQPTAPTVTSGPMPSQPGLDVPDFLAEAEQSYVEGLDPFGQTASTLPEFPQSGGPAPVPRPYTGPDPTAPETYFKSQTEQQAYYKLPEAQQKAYLQNQQRLAADPSLANRSASLGSVTPAGPMPDTRNLLEKGLDATETGVGKTIDFGVESIKNVGTNLKEDPIGTTKDLLALYNIAGSAFVDEDGDGRDDTTGSQAFTMEEYEAEVAQRGYGALSNINPMDPNYAQAAYNPGGGGIAAFQPENTVRMADGGIVNRAMFEQMNPEFMGAQRRFEGGNIYLPNWDWATGLDFTGLFPPEYQQQLKEAKEKRQKERNEKLESGELFDASYVPRALRKGSFNYGALGDTEVNYGGRQGKTESYGPADLGLGPKYGAAKVNPLVDQTKLASLDTSRVMAQPQAMMYGGEVDGPGTGTSDSIPAYLSDGEFVMTAKAVRGAGGGDRKKGAARMYAMMNQFEGRA